MNPVELAAIVVGVFFAAGIAVGVLAVIAMSVLRRERENGDESGGGGEPPTWGYGPYEEFRDERRQWPDGTLTG